MDRSNMFLGWWAVLSLIFGVVFHSVGLHIGFPLQNYTAGCELCHVWIFKRLL